MQQSVRAGLFSVLFVFGGLVQATAGQSGGYLLVANKGDKSMSIVDPATHRQIATVAEPDTTGHELIASPDGKTAYVPIYGDSGVGRPGSDGRLLAVIDVATRKVVGTVDFGRGLRPHCPVINPKTGLLYVTTELDQSVTIVDPKSLKVVGSVPTGQPESHMLVISRDGKRGYTSNVGAGTVSVLDLEARKTLAIVPVAKRAQRILLSVDDKWAFTADQDQPRLAVIDTATNKVDHWIPLPGIGFGAAVTKDGQRLLIALPAAKKMAVVNLKTRTVERTVDTPAEPQQVLIRPDEKIAYVSCDDAAQVAAIRLSDWKVEALIDAGPQADGLAWAASR